MDCQARTLEMGPHTYVHLLFFSCLRINKEKHRSTKDKMGNVDQNDLQNGTCGECNFMLWDDLKCVVLKVGGQSVQFRHNKFSPMCLTTFLCRYRCIMSIQVHLMKEFHYHNS